MWGQHTCAVEQVLVVLGLEEVAHVRVMQGIVFVEGHCSETCGRDGVRAGWASG